MPKAITWSNEDGSKYKISYSEELQRKNLEAAKKQTEWLRMNFYAKVLLLIVGLVGLIVFLYLLNRLDAIDFFTRIAYR